MPGRVVFLAADVLPAYAGMILLGVFDSQLLASAPRVCGDDPYGYICVVSKILCSPRMRG